MIQFWKKSGRKEVNQSNLSTSFESTHSTDYNSKSDENSCTIQKPAALISIDEKELNDIIKEADNIEEYSKLSKTLLELLSDKSSLGYFIQFMKSRNALAFVYCWIDINNFNWFLQETLGDHKYENTCVSPVLSYSKTDHESLSLSTDSYTADSNSLYDYVENIKCDETKLDCYKINNKNDTNADETKTTQKFVDYALKIFKKYIALEATHNIMCTEEIRKEIIENICDADAILNINCFDKVQTYLLDTMERDYLQEFLGSDYYCKHQIDVLTSGHIVLKDILYNETALFYFMEFLEQENGRDLLQFWLAATNFQQQLQSQQREFFDPHDAQNDAVVLYDKYFSLQALCPLGFDDKIRFIVEQNICGDSEFILDCFQLPLKVVEYVLEKNYLKPFLCSQLFYKYLSELINTVQTNGYMNGVEKNKHSPSDCSSEKSFCTNSTFLAMENPNRAKKSKSSDMFIDVRQLYDPDSLWRRKKSNRLSFGRITELGRFETDFEPEPDKNKATFKSVVKKFINLEENKRKEEMAWQVAEMIVKDITSITLNEQKPFQS